MNERLDSLERQVRWLQAGLAVAVLALAGMGAAGSMEIRAKRLVIEDDKGRDRIVLDASADNPRIVLRDGGHGTARFSVDLDKHGLPHIDLSDGAGNTIASVDGYADGPKVEAKRSGEDKAGKVFP